MAEVTVISRARSDRLGEGPWWSAREAALYWVDILDCRLNRLGANEKIDEWVLPEMTGWVIEREDAAGFVAGMRSGIKALSLDPFGVVPLADLPEEPQSNRMNDAKADSAGLIWAGTMPISCDVPTGSLYRLGADHRVERVDQGYCVANGPAIAPDGAFLLHTDSVKGQIYRFDLRDDGGLGPREPYINFEQDWGAPDGMTFDRDGGLWVACWGGSSVRRFIDGKLDRAIALPASQITSVTFGGAKLDRMFVTSAADGVDEPLGGALFEVAPGVTGFEPHRYKG